MMPKSRTTKHEKGHLEEKNKERKRRENHKVEGEE